MWYLYVYGTLEMWKEELVDAQNLECIGLDGGDRVAIQVKCLNVWF